MKKLFSKALPAIAVALLLTSVVSCNSKPQDEPGTPGTVSVPMGVFYSIPETNDAVSKALNKLKEFQFITGYTNSGIIYDFTLVEFKQTNVNPIDTTKVKADLIVKADNHYTTALNKVKEFDFNTLFSNEIIVSRLMLTISFNNKDYEANILLQNPLIWDKRWGTTVNDCPIQEMSFSQSGETVSGTLTLLGGETVQTTSARRNTSDKTVLQIGTTDYKYTFSILSQTQIQLIRIKPTGGEAKNVTGSNYIFNHKN